MRPFSLSVALAIGCAVALLSLVARDVARSEEVSLEPPTAGSVRLLEPGSNLIGWLGDTRSVERLREEIPEISSVEEWDTQAQRFAQAEALEPGRGYRILMSGDESILWEPPDDPVLGTVRLRRGRNLVAWLGPDDWSIDRVVQGIGSSFVQAEWSTHVYRPAEPGALMTLPAVERGAALWIEVSRNVNWLQPTGKLPTIRFPGGATPELKAQVESDLEIAIRFFRESFGFEADATKFKVFVPTDVEALIDTYRHDAPERVATAELLASLRSFYRLHGGWVANGDRLVIKEFHWYEGHERSGPDRRLQSRRHLVAHEYAHVVQDQLRDFGSRATPSYSTGWLVEGTAEWADRMLRQWEGLSSRGQLYANALAAVAGAQHLPLQDDLRSERYRLGLVASFQLAERAGDDSIWDFWRLLAPTWFGPFERWRIDPPWEDAFAIAFGVSADDFYAEFEHWREQQYRQVSGRISFASTAAHGEQELLLGLPVFLRGKVDDGSEDGVWKRFNARLDARGEFTIAALPGTYRLHVDLGDCTLDRASDILVAHEDLSGIRFEIGADQCVYSISGRLVDATGAAVSGEWIRLKSDTADRGQYTDAAGRFDFVLPSADSYRLLVTRERCSIYYARPRAVTLSGDAERLTVGDSDISGLLFTLPDGACSNSISGRLLGADGTLIARAWVTAFNDDYSQGAWTDAEGNFKITLPTAGRYRLRASINRCETYFRRGGSARLERYATRITIDNRDVEEVEFKLSIQACARIVSGRLLDGDGDGIAEAGIALFGEGDGSADSYTETDSDGSFRLAAPWRGGYRLRAVINGCSVFRQRDGVTSSVGSAHRVRVSDADISDIVVQLGPDNCVHRIQGRLLNADGSPRAVQWLYATAQTGSTGAHTSSDGSFSILIPARGTYAIGMWIDGCWLYRAGNGITRNWHVASKHQITNRDVTGIEFRLPEDPASVCN